MLYGKQWLLNNPIHLMFSHIPITYLGSRLFYRFLSRLVKYMKNWKKWIDKDVIVTMKDGEQLSGVLKGPVIPSKNTIPDEFRLLNGVFVTRIKTKDISTIQDAF